MICALIPGNLPWFIAFETESRLRPMSRANSVVDISCFRSQSLVLRLKLSLLGVAMLLN
jgi:hypothetical protein